MIISFNLDAKSQSFCGLLSKISYHGMEHNHRNHNEVEVHGMKEGVRDK